MRRVRIKPGKGTSFITMIGGIFMIGFGITEAIPTFGNFGVLWTLMAFAITAYSAFNAFSDRGLATQEIEVEDSSDSDMAQTDVADRLERLKSLRMDGLITEEEYQRKRNEIVKAL
jgi:putative oligomerization/nucleic acid binding protein